MEVVKKENLVATVGKYTTPQGEEKKVYRTIGELTTFSDGQRQFQKAELYMFPNLNLSVYPKRDKEAPQQGRQQNIDTEQIPF